MCTSDSWNALNIEHSTVPAELPVRYGTEVTVTCKENYSSASVVTCGTDGQFTGDKPTCQSGKR